MGARDRHCVGSTEELERTEHALTVVGMMSGRGGRFDKPDQVELTANWMTGFDNKDRLRLLQSELREQVADCDRKRKKTEHAVRKQQVAAEKVQLIERLEKASFEAIDLPSATGKRERLQKRLAAILDPASDTASAKKAYDAATAALEKTRERRQAAEQKVAKLEVRLQTAEERRNGSAKRIGSDLDEAERTDRGRITELRDREEVRRSEQCQELVRRVEPNTDPCRLSGRQLPAASGDARGSRKHPSRRPGAEAPSRREDQRRPRREPGGEGVRGPQASEPIRVTLADCREH